MGIKVSKPPSGGVVHADHGSQFAPWAFTNKIHSSGLMPSVGTVGDCFDNATMESSWSSMQIALLNRKKWRTRVDFSNEIFEYIEIFFNRQRQHSKIGYQTPIEHEPQYEEASMSA
jgi:putative transposase